MTKSLAQLAFEAATSGTGILWEKLDPPNRKAWERAAEAVETAVKERMGVMVERDAA